MSVFLLGCLLAAGASASPTLDPHVLELKQHYEHVSYIASHPCHAPQVRVFPVHELFTAEQRHGKAYYPDVTVLHECSGAGSCTSGHHCVATETHPVTLPFKITFLQDMDGHEKGSWIMEYHELLNHTVCGCAAAPKLSPDKIQPSCGVSLVHGTSGYGANSGSSGYGTSGGSSGSQLGYGTNSGGSGTNLGYGTSGGSSGSGTISGSSGNNLGYGTSSGSSGYGTGETSGSQLGYGTNSGGSAGNNLGYGTSSSGSSGYGTGETSGSQLGYGSSSSQPGYGSGSSGVDPLYTSVGYRFGDSDKEDGNSTSTTEVNKDALTFKDE